MAITPVGGSYADVASGTVSTDLSALDSGTIAAGDVAILTVFVDQDDLTSIDQTAGPTFTSAHYDESTAGRDRASELFYRVLDGTETTVSFDSTGDLAEEKSILVSIWRGVDNTTPFDVVWSTVDHYLEGQNNWNGTPQPITTVTNGAMVVISQTITHDDITAAGAPTDYTIAIDGTGTARDHRQQIHVYREIAAFGTETPGPFNHTVNATVSEAQFRTIALRPAPTSGITSIDSPRYGDQADEIDVDEDIDLNGLDFAATGNTVYLADAATLAASIREVDVSAGIGTESTTEITVDLGSLGATPRANLETLIATDGHALNAIVDTGTAEYSLPVTVHRALAFTLSASPNITTGAVDTTTPRLTPPAGKTTGDHDAGRRSDDTSPLPTTTISADDYQENEWALEGTAEAFEATYDFEVVYEDGTPLESYGQAIQVTIGASGPPEGTIDPAAQGAIDFAGARDSDGAIDPAAQGAVDFVGARDSDGAAAVAAQGAVDFAGQRDSDGVAAYGAQAALAFVGQAPELTPEGTIDPAAQAALAVSAQRDSDGAIDPAAQGAVDFAGARDSDGAVVMAAQAAVGFTGQRSSSGVAAYGAQVVVAFVGQAPELTPEGTIDPAAEAEVDFVGARDSDGAIGVAGQGAVDFAGQRDSDGAIDLVAEAEVDFVGERSSSGTVAYGAQVVLNVIGLAPGSGGVAQYGAQGALDVTGQRTSSADINPAAEAEVDFVGARDSAGAIGVAGQGAVDFVGQADAQGIAAFAGQVVVAFVGQAPQLAPEGTIDPAAEAEVDFVGQRSSDGVAALGAQASIAFVGQAPAEGVVAFAALGALRILAAVTGSHPLATTTSKLATVNVMATPDGDTILVLARGNSLRYIEHPGWAEWAGDPGTLVPVS